MSGPVVVGGVVLGASEVVPARSKCQRCGSLLDTGVLMSLSLPDKEKFIR